MEITNAPLLTELERVFGKASAAGFGSAVFHGQAKPTETSASIAWEHFKSFLGPKWTPERQKAWEGGWKLLYTRPAAAEGNIMAELGSISDPEGKRAIPLLTELIEDADTAKKALTAAFNHADVRQLSMHHLGDGEAISGIMISALYNDGMACSVIALMD
jgi:hypothetical protein